MEHNLFTVLEQRAEQQPDHQALIGPTRGSSLTYHELVKQISDTARSLLTAGVRPGDALGIHYPSGSDYVILTYAAWCIGACAVPIAIELTSKEKQQISFDISLCGIVSQARQAQHYFGQIFDPPIVLTEHISFLRSKSLRKPPAGFQHLNPAFLRFTSGTTAKSKGVVLSHQTVWERIHAANEVLAIGPNDRIGFLLSMSYHFTVSIVSYLSFGATIVLCPTALGETLQQTLLEHETTIIYGSPTHYELLAKTPTGSLPPALRLALSTTTRLTPETAKTFHQRYGTPLTQAYGIIEVGLPCINIKRSYEKPDSVGQLLPAYEMKLRPVRESTVVHEILLRGPGMIDAYYQPFRTQAEILEDGWFVTGDLATIDADGDITISGRDKDLISVAGMKFFAQEVESVLNSHHLVQDACITLRPHQTLGEVPEALVELTSPKTENMNLKQELLQYCRSKLAPFKVPTDIHFTAALERTASGKIKPQRYI